MSVFVRSIQPHLRAMEGARVLGPNTFMYKIVHFLARHVRQNASSLPE